MIRKFNYMAMVSAAILFAAANANASGYQLNEFSATNLGRAFAGIGVVGDDYSAIAFNPAGMILKDSGGQLGVTSVQEHVKVKGNIYYDGDPINSGKPDGRMNLFKYMPHLFVQHKVNDDLAFGLGVFTPFGLATDYNKHWFGATHGTKTDLEVVDISPTVAYRMGKLTLGAGWIIRYVHGDVRNQMFDDKFTKKAVPNSKNQMDLDGWSANSWSLGALYEFSENTRIGFSYRYNNAHTVKGDHNMSGLPAPMAGLNGRHNGRSKMTLPSTATLSAYHKLNDKYAVTATARWTKWNIFDDFVMTSDTGLGAPIPEKWSNVVTYSLGLDYYYNDQWTFRGGVAYDPTPVGTKRYRTVRIPDSDRIWVTAGFSYKTEKFQYDLGYSHLFMKSAKSLNTDAGNGSIANVKYKSYSNMLGLQVQYNF